MGFILHLSPFCPKYLFLTFYSHTLSCYLFPSPSLVFSLSLSLSFPTLSSLFPSELYSPKLTLNWTCLYYVTSNPHNLFYHLLFSSPCLCFLALLLLPWLTIEEWFNQGECPPVSLSHPSPYCSISSLDLLQNWEVSRTWLVCPLNLLWPCCGSHSFILPHSIVVLVVQTLPNHEE